MARHVGSVRRRCLTAVAVAVAIVGTAGQAEARHHHGGLRRGHAEATHHRPGHASLVDGPGFSAMVVDAGTGRTLYAANEDALRHPASITKVMTLYLLFEKLKSGGMTLDTRIGVSHHAASMAPTKLGLRPGSTIAVEDAVKAVVTKSANDMAVAIAEAVGGDEDSFAAMMTRKAHALGMSRTTYVNASGLPDDRQITTARDLTVLGRSIRETFPAYYHFFSTPSFTYAGSFMPNHNHLLGKVEGMDGIKTGYTRASGFNLLSSVNRGGHRIVSVVLGGHTAAARDRIMSALIEEHIEEAAPTRVAGVEPPRPVEQPAPPVRTADLDDEDDGAKERGPSLIAPTLAVPPVPVGRPNDRARTVSQMTTGSIPIERPRPAFIAGAPSLEPSRLPAPFSQADRRRLALDGSTQSRPSQAGAAPTATPSSLRWVIGPKAAAARPSTRTAAADKPVPADRVILPSPRPGAWVIQVGATDNADDAENLLSRARSQGRSTLATAKPFTEKVRRGDATLYRARFAGLGTDEAEEACRTLKRSGFACFATKE